MARSYEQEVAALKGLDPRSPAAADELRKILRAKRGMTIAMVAKLVEDNRLEALVEDLAAAFGTILGAKADPGCRGKIAIAKALHALDEWDERVFVAGLAIEQPEGPAPPEDTAAALRGICGLAHVHFYKANATDVLTALLADPARNARIAAAQGFADSGRTDCTSVLRYKLLVDDDEDPEVIGACFDALFALAREATATFAISLLEQGGAIAEAAAIALGSNRVAEAVEPLAQWCIGTPLELRHRVGYVAIALLRTDAGNEMLLDRVSSGGRDGIGAARALATFKDDAQLMARLRATVADLDAKTRREIDAIVDG